LFFSVCTEMIYPELRVEDRTARVAAHGFDSVDIWDWRTKDPGALKDQMRSHGVSLNSFVGQTRSSTSVAGEKGAFLAELRESIDFAQRLECRNITVFSERLVPRGAGAGVPVMPGASNDTPDEEKVANIVGALTDACDLAERSGVVLLLEALNNGDHPLYFLNNSRLTLEIVRRVGRRSLKMLYDIYHMQVSEGNITRTILGNLDSIGYIQFGDVPGRHEPGTGELNLPYILEALASASYTGGLGFEYTPSGSDEAALEAIRRVISPYL